MRRFVYGNKVKLLAYKTNNYYAFACAQRMKLTYNTELKPTSTPDSGKWRTFKPSGLNDWNVELDMVTVLKDDVDTLWFSWETMLLSIRSSGLDVKFEFTDRLGFQKTAQGKVYIPTGDIEGISGDISTSTIKLQGSGPLNITDLITPPTTQKQMRLEWIATGAEPNVVQNNQLIGVTVSRVMQVSWEGDDKFKVITVGSPTHKEVKLDNVAGTLTFMNNFAPFDFIYAVIDI